MFFALENAVPVRRRDDGLLEKDTFDISTAVPTKDIPQIGEGKPRYSKPLSDQDRARALYELSEKEAGRELPISKKVEWTLSSDKARDVVTAVENTLLTGGMYPVVQGIRGALDGNGDYNMFDRLWRGIINPEATARFTDKAVVENEPKWARITRSIAEDVLSYGAVGMVGARAKTALFARDVARKVEQAADDFVATKIGSAPAEEGVLTGSQAEMVGSIDDMKDGFIRAQMSKLGALEVSNTGAVKTSASALYERKSMVNLILSELDNLTIRPQGVGSNIANVKIGQKVSFTEGGKDLIGTITEIVGKRATIDMGGKQVVAMLSQLRVPEVVEPKPKDFKTSKERDIVSAVTGRGTIKMVNIPKGWKVAAGKRVDDIESSVKSEGIKSPIIVDKESGEVIDGYGRISAADRLGIEEVPVIYIDKNGLSESNFDLLVKMNDEGKLTSEWQAAQGGTPPPPEKPTAVSPGEPELPKDPYEAVVHIDKVKKHSTTGKDFSEFIDKAFVPISTRLSKIDESLKDAIRQHAFQVNMSTKSDMDASVPFLRSMAKMDRADALKLDFALKNGDTEFISNMVKKYGIEAEYQAVRNTLDGIYARAKDAGMDVGYLPDYFPRRIIDTEAYLKFLRGTEDWGSISKALQAEEANIGRPLLEEEKAEVINSMIRGFGKEKIPVNKPSNVKERKIVQLTPEMNAFYKDSGMSLVEYIKAMNDNIESRVFFGKEKNLENSIGNYVARLVEDKIISLVDEESVRQILKSYFDKRGTHGIVTGFKNFSYIASMGSPTSAITQIGDLAFSLYKNGYFGTVKAALKKDKITKQDIGLDLIAEEFTDPSRSSKAVTAVFKTIGLDAMDAFGKEVLINSALDRLSKLALSGDKELTSTLHRVFKDKAPQVIDDLKNQVPTDDVKYILFSELANFQPIALTEMPEYYVRGGNMRIFYMLKSYTIKQIDVFHNEIFREKDPAKKANKALRLALALMLTGATADTLKDIILGRKTKIEDLVVDNILKLVGFSKWQLYKTRQDGMFSTLLQSILPPVPFLDDIYKDAMKYTNKKKKPKIEDLRIWQRIPIVGKFYYWWFGGGQDIGKKKIIIRD